MVQFKRKREREKESKFKKYTYFLNLFNKINIILVIKSRQKEILQTDLDEFLCGTQKYSYFTVSNFKIYISLNTSTFLFGI